MGVRAVSERGDGCPPVRVTGGLTGGRAQLSGSISSQYLSALLFIGPLAPQGLEIDITGELVSRPYVDLTLEVLADFGITYYREGYRYFPAPRRPMLPAPGLRDRGRRLQRLVFLGRGGLNRRAGHHHQPEP